ncbi:D-amino acid dehydrogenase small subunit [Roseovarius albus]|uniref:D-amino acid dehydrogenase small subunit n=1 Tax=Roseovarius albus TaxID=1247867 RepID=A0A1X7A7R4_9RHOB|nr:FAD-binding oxidoreductase [Roseovarius albus]SLN72267.1 D-amino acid dehydrogenase small subunit [Roseovarius albus]
MSTSLKIVVIGAGICGLSSAIWLQRSGHQVTLIDREGPGAGASYGNAGLMAQWAFIPVNTPGLIKDSIKYLTDPSSPLFMQWGQVPRLAPWLWQFVKRANAKDARYTAQALIDIIADGGDQHRALTRATQAEEMITSSDFVYAYASRKDFDKDNFGWGIRREAGFVPEMIEGAAVQEFDPMLGPSIQCLARLKTQGHILDPGGYMHALADILRAEGGQVAQAEAKDFTLHDGKISSVETDQGGFPCDHAVLTTGIWSKALMKKLGFKVMLETERGHHLHLKNPSQIPRCPMILGKGKFGVTPMSTGLRCAGTVELGTHERGASRAPLELIRKQITKDFPNLEYDVAEEWVGYRPSTPDSLPLIGEIGKTGVYAGFGHQHIGLTAGPKTGRLIADLISGRKPNIDLSPFDANRFDRH